MSAATFRNDPSEGNARKQHNNHMPNSIQSEDYDQADCQCYHIVTAATESDVIRQSSYNCRHVNNELPV